MRRWRVSCLKVLHNYSCQTNFVRKNTQTKKNSTAAYAKSAARYWESNSPEGCKDIAEQLVHGEVGSHLDVILGGGYREFLPVDTKDPQGRSGKRTDKRDLIRERITSPRRVWFAHDRVNDCALLA